MRGQAMLLAGALFAAGAAAPAPAAAQGFAQPPVYEDPWCKQQRQNRMLIGGLIGAAAGAALGNNVAARNAQAEGSLLGGVVGAAAGAAVGRQTAQCRQPFPSAGAQSYGGAGYGAGPGFGPTAFDAPGLAGAPGYHPSRDPAAFEDCRWGTSTVTGPDGRSFTEEVFLCKGADGVWRRQ